MKNNNLIAYKENFFTKIANFFKNIFFSSSKAELEDANISPSYNSNEKEDFIENIVVREDKEEKRLKTLQLQYDNEELDEEDISDEDMEKLIEMYEKETEQLNAETLRIKEHIAQMLKELKQA